MNFGPLSRLGGERRLNVAITRAKYNIKLVGSILPTDINDTLGFILLIKRGLLLVLEPWWPTFKKDILVFGIVRKDFIDLLEKEYIKFYRSIGKAEYNIADGGEGNGGWNKGIPMSNEQKM